MLCEVTRWAKHENSYGRGFSWFAGPIFFTDATAADGLVAESLIAELQAEDLLAGPRLLH